ENYNNTQKRKGLDALRGIGITGIVLYHIFPTAVRGGFLGVPLFFVLSGYLMFITSERNWEQGDFHIGSYYIKRVRKIVPPLFTNNLSESLTLDL
ncbi:MAG: acyltransferase, partial [Lachnospiraceae bacterium]|nr:acyltransferase [Lachnospiraceae bacterium]